MAPAGGGNLPWYGRDWSGAGRSGLCPALAPPLPPVLLSPVQGGEVPAAGAFGAGVSPGYPQHR